MKEVLEYVEGYMGASSRPVVRQMMKKNLEAFTIAGKSKLQEVVEYVEEYTGESSKSAVQKMIQRQRYKTCFHCQ